MQVVTPKAMATLSMLVALVLAAPAAAQTPTQNTYGGPLAEQLPPATVPVQPQVVPPGPATLPGSDQGSTQTQGKTKDVLGRRVSGKNPVAPAAAPRPAPKKVSGDELPFTGFEIGVALAIAFALLGTGFALRRATRTS